MDQGFLPVALSPCNSLGQDCSTSPNTQTTVTGALIGTYCTSTNTNSLSDVVATAYTGDFITIDGKPFFLKIRVWHEIESRFN